MLDASLGRKCECVSLRRLMIRGQDAGDTVVRHLAESKPGFHHVLQLFNFLIESR